MTAYAKGCVKTLRIVIMMGKIDTKPDIYSEFQSTYPTTIAKSANLPLRFFTI
ncbi:MAG: hypothetical protein ACI9UT_001073 [Flavobacteriales bacterium]|jgi:hypothetical protein